MLFFVGDLRLVVVYPKEKIAFEGALVDQETFWPEDRVERRSVFRAMGGAGRGLVPTSAFGDVRDAAGADALTVSLEERPFHCRVGSTSLACWEM